MQIFSNAGKLARLYRQRVQRFRAAHVAGLRAAAVAVDRAQVANLSGPRSAAPGSYPVPNRTGNLMGAHFFRVAGDRFALVGNTAAYAAKIHDDRPYLDDAVETTDPGGIYIATVQKAVMAV